MCRWRCLHFRVGCCQMTRKTRWCCCIKFPRDRIQLMKTWWRYVKVQLKACWQTSCAILLGWLVHKSLTYDKSWQNRWQHPCRIKIEAIPGVLTLTPDSLTQIQGFQRLRNPHLGLRFSEILTLGMCCWDTCGPPLQSMLAMKSRPHSRSNIWCLRSSPATASYSV